MIFRKKLLATSALLLTATFSHAATTTYDFTGSGPAPLETGSGYGNTLDYGDFQVTAWATTGVPINSNSLIDDAQILDYGSGLGVCNRTESCSFPNFQVDNMGDDDYVLFVFDQAVQFDSIVIDPYGYFDRDITFWTANISTPADLTGLDPAALDFPGSTIFGDPTFNYNTWGYGPKTINLNGGIGNALLFAAQADPGNIGDYDAFKITSLTTTVVPVPAALWLFGSGLIGLVGLARRRITR